MSSSDKDEVTKGLSIIRQLLKDIQVLQGYFGQLHVEKGFRFLKHPEFLAGALFLKKPERIMVLLTIMTLCLMVYVALEYRIRKELKEQELTVLQSGQKTSQLSHCTMIFHWFVGIRVLLWMDSVWGCSTLRINAGKLSIY